MVQEYLDEYKPSAVAYTAEKYAAFLKIMKSRQEPPLNTYNALNIVIEDSYIKYTSNFERKSFILDPRSPFKKDATIIDYDMDSEDEWNELNGEDLGADMECSESDEGSEVEAGFIVPDNYLS